MKNNSLDDLGKKLMESVRDKSISTWDRILRGILRKWTTLKY